MKKRSFAGLLSGVLAVSALAAPPIYAQGAAPAMAPVALGFDPDSMLAGESQTEVCATYSVAKVFLASSASAKLVFSLSRRAASISSRIPSTT